MPAKIFLSSPGHRRPAGRPAHTSAEAKARHARAAALLLIAGLGSREVGRRLGVSHTEALVYARKALGYDDLDGVGALRRAAAERGMFGETIAEAPCN